MGLAEDNNTSLPPGGHGTNSNNIWMPRDASLLAIIAINTIVTLVFGCILTVCIMKSLSKRARRREERDKLGNIIQNNYWEAEEQISKVLHIFQKMKLSTVFRDVTELHVFAYRYRCDCGVYAPQEQGDNGNDAFKWRQLESTSMSSTMAVVKKLDRLFEMLTLQLPCQGVCPISIASAFGSTFYSIAANTSLIWSDHKGRLIRNIVHYFAGRSAAERFDSGLISDEELETLVLARVPYINQLYLNEDHFVLQDVDISSDLKIDLKNKIRYVDTVLAKNSKTLQNKEKNITEAYYSAREICVKNSFVQNKNHLPDIVTKVGEASKLGECIVLLRHLLRVMCIGKNMKKLESDDKFFQFLMQLHEALYTWSDTNTMVEVIERIRSNIISYLRGLTIEQMLIDKEFTKAKLEHFEKELYRHLNYLTLRQVQQEKMRRHIPGAQETDPKLRTVGSDSSIYTMALSTSSFLMRQPSTEERSRHQDLEMLHQQRSLDQSSIVSGSSMYATAISVSSGDNNAPSSRRSPPPSRSPPESRSPPRVQSPLRHQHSLPSPLEANEYYETAV